MTTLENQIHYLVLNNSKNDHRPYAEKYRVFNNRDAAVNAFTEAGGDANNFGMGLSERVGIASIQKGGVKNLDLLFMPIEIQTKQ